MEFCPKCGGMILIEKGKAKCTKCRYRPKKKPKIQSSEKVETKKAVAVINEKESSTEPVVDMKCPKCKNPKAFFWTKQTRAADESETKFYKCTKCSHTWRVYK